MHGCVNTVPFKCKLTVSTQFSILKVFENRVSRLEFRFSRIENRVSSFKTLEEFFEDLEPPEISRKRLNSRKQNSSDEQSNWRAALFAQTRFEYMQIFFRVVHFLQGTCGSVLCISTEADNSMTASYRTIRDKSSWHIPFTNFRS